MLFFLTGRGNRGRFRLIKVFVSMIHPLIWVDVADLRFFSNFFCLFIFSVYLLLTSDGLMSASSLFKELYLLIVTEKELRGNGNDVLVIAYK